MIIKRIFKSNSDDMNLKNEPFEIIGKLIPLFNGDSWSYEIKLNNQVSSMCYPNETYSYDDTKGKYIFLGAYANGVCIGLVILKHSMSKYIYLYDIKVNKEYRRNGIGKQLIEKAKEVAKENDYIGIYSKVANDNVIACNFYLKNNFKIGGIDNKIYSEMDNQGKIEIEFYLDL